MMVTLNTALSALMAHQAGVDTVSHNVANVSTPGYSRQRVTLHAVPGTYTPDGVPRPGMGVQVVSVDRVRDLFVDYQVRTQNHAAGKFSMQAQSLQQAEAVLAEPTDSGLRASLSAFFNSWRDLSNNPESAPARTAVIEAGSTFALTARRIDAGIGRLRDDANARVGGAIDEINGLASEVARLNDAIQKLSVGGQNPNDLRDQRDAALDRLSTLASIQYIERSDGMIDVAVGGHPLVTGQRSHALVGVPNAGNSNYLDVEFEDGQPLSVTGGEVAGLLHQRDTDLPQRLADLDTLVSSVMTEVNTTHAAGFGLDGVDGRAFFVGTGAADIEVDPAVVADPQLLAASASAAGVPGDGSNALAVTDLQYARLMAGGTAIFDDYYGNYVASLGVASREAQSRESTQTLVLQQLEQQRQSVSGVNLDEEIVSLTQYQRAYEAASHLVRKADEMLDTLINRTI